MKIGDKLLCKKTIYPFYDKGKFYTIERIDEGTPDMPSDIGKLVTMKGNVWNSYNRKNLKFSLRNLQVIDKYITTPKYLWDFFYTTQEIRKRKLEQIDSK